VKVLIYAFVGRGLYDLQLVKDKGELLAFVGLLYSKLEFIILKDTNPTSNNMPCLPIKKFNLKL